MTIAEMLLPASPPQATAPTAFGAVWARLRRRALRTAAFMIVLCSAITLLLAALGGELGVKAVNSFAIGLGCWTVTEATRLIHAGLVDRWRSWRGQPRSSAGFEAGWRGILPATLLGMLTGPLLGLALADTLTGRRSPSLLSLDATSTRITLALTLVASLAAVFALSALERLAAARARAEAAQRLAAENQLRLLQSQLEPHMLFNTLANLRVLIGLDPPRAQAMLDRMIAFLRATLNASRMDLQPLQAEFERLSDYLALMAVRMGPRLQVRLQLPDALRSLPVPPLLLQPLVENAIQHGLEPKVDGGTIELQAWREGASLVLQVRDSGVGLRAPGQPGTGFGLGQVRERLATLYGDQASLTLSEAPDGGGTLATVRLPAG